MMGIFEMVHVLNQLEGKIIPFRARSFSIDVNGVSMRGKSLACFCCFSASAVFPLYDTLVAGTINALYCARSGDRCWQSNKAGRGNAQACWRVRCSTETFFSAQYCI